MYLSILFHNYSNTFYLNSTKTTYLEICLLIANKKRALPIGKARDLSFEQFITVS